MANESADSHADSEQRVGEFPPRVLCCLFGFGHQARSGEDLALVGALGPPAHPDLRRRGTKSLGVHTQVPYLFWRLDRCWPLSWPLLTPSSASSSPAERLGSWSAFKCAQPYQERDMTPRHLVPVGRRRRQAGPPFLHHLHTTA